MTNVAVPYVLHVEGLMKEVPALDAGVDARLVLLHATHFSISQGESVAIVGPSGAGKSTLLGLLAGLDTPSAGRVVVDGVDLTALDEDGRAAVRAAKVGFVFQSFQLLANLTALENVMLPLELAGDVKAQDKARDELARVGLAERLHHYPRQLSGGEQQRVAIARAFVTRPRLLLADEPTGNLDAATGRTIIDLLFNLNKDYGATLVLVTHDPALAGRCNRQLHLHDGVLQAS